MTDLRGDDAFEVIRLRRELRRVHRELANAYASRDALGRRLGAGFASILWRWWCKPLWWLARARGRLRIPLGKLATLSDCRPDDAGTGWHGDGLPELMLPLPLPVTGWVRVRAVIDSSIASRAVLYVDTGRGLSEAEKFVLGPVAGRTVIDRMIAFRKPAFSIRFDPIQAQGVCEVPAFDFEPVSGLWFNARVLWTNLKLWFGPSTPDQSPILDRPEDRPSFRHDLKLLASGRVVEFHQRLVDRVQVQPIVADYDRWVYRHAVTDADRARMRDEIARWIDPPVISVVLPVYDVDEPYLRQCIESVTKQIYPLWELCIADDRSPSPHVRRVLDEYAAADHRIKVTYRSTNGNISAASNSALELATGPYTALLDHDDEISEDALYWVADRIAADPAIDWVYSDEDKITPDGTRFDPFFKPDWSPEYLLACMYVSHLSVYRTSLIRRVGQWRSAFDGAQDYDLALRVSATDPVIAHVPRILYHWRTIPSSTATGQQVKPDALPRAAVALQDYLDTCGRPGHVEPGPSAGFFRVRYRLPQPPPKVSLVIPTAGKAARLNGKDTWFVVQCVDGVRKRSTYPNLEIVVIDNADLSPALIDALLPMGVRRISYTEPFNLARKMNFGVAAASGEYVVLLNDDIEVISTDWVEAMLEYCQWPGVGAVGAQLLFPDDRLQHAGVILLDGNPHHAFYGYPGDHPGYYYSSQATHNWSAVTGACLMTRRDVYQQVGGFTESLPLNFNDVDYCLKLRRAGQRIAYVPHARMYHHESVSKPATPASEVDTFKYLWGDSIRVDPYYSPNLTQHGHDFAMG